MSELTLNRGAYFEETSRGVLHLNLAQEAIFSPLVSVPSSLSLSVSAAGLFQAKVSPTALHLQLGFQPLLLRWAVSLPAPFGIGEEK